MKVSGILDWAQLQRYLHVRQRLEIPELRRSADSVIEPAALSAGNRTRFRNTIAIVTDLLPARETLSTWQC